AEDGIRDGHVTGVQTCALPISQQMPLVEEKEEHLKELAEWTRGKVSWLDEIYNLTALIPNLRMLQVSEFEGALLPAAKDKPIARSEERRVGKECRSRWSQ